MHGAGPRERRRAGRDRRAFTLVELLVAVAVIGLLVTMLVPSLGRSRSYARSAICKSNLKQMWELLQGDGDSLRLPEPWFWLEVVIKENAEALARCPEDTFEGVTELALGDVYLVQDPGGLTFYPVMEIIQNPAVAESIFQCQVFVRGQGQYEFWIGNYMNTSVLDESDADGACLVRLGSNCTIEPLWAPGCLGCGSDHWVCHGPNIGTGAWTTDVVRRLTGVSYRTVDPPYNVVGLPCSYGMNARVAPLDAPPDQLLLLDYRKLVADPDADTIAGELEYLDPGRHLGKVNAVFVGGDVRTLWPDELTPSAPLWK